MHSIKNNKKTQYKVPAHIGNKEAAKHAIGMSGITTLYKLLPPGTDGKLLPGSLFWQWGSKDEKVHTIAVGNTRLN